MLKHLQFALVACLTFSSNGATATSDKPDTWWECSQHFRFGEATQELSGRIFRTVSVNGTSSSNGYEMWGQGIRVAWTADKANAGRDVQSLDVTIPCVVDENKSGVYGYIFGDDTLKQSVTMLSVKNAQKGYATCSAFFYNRGFGLGLESHDRWSFKVMRGNGELVAQRILPFPDRLAREAAFLRSRAAIDEAWLRRDQTLLVTQSADTLPLQRGICLLSTPTARDELEQSSI